MKSEPLWSVSFPGTWPKIYLTRTRLWFQFGPQVDQQPRTPTTLVCLDRAGREAWRREGRYVLATLPDDTCLTDTPAGGGLCVLDSDGATVLGQAGRTPYAYVHRHADRLALGTSDGRVVVTDLSLKPHAGFRWPGQDSPKLSCLIGDHFYWVVEQVVWRCDLTGVKERFDQLSAERVEAAQARYEAASGLPAVPGGTIFAPGVSGGRPSAIGDRFNTVWSLSPGPADGVFAHNFTTPYLVACLAGEGAPRWVRYFSPGCCGGPPVRLPDGAWVASSGCGETLTWFDDEGEVEHQAGPITDRTERWSPYSTEPTALSSGLVLVAGGPGLLAYLRGALQWSIEGTRLAYRVCEEEGLLFLATWNDRVADGVVTLEGHRLPT